MIIHNIFGLLDDGEMNELFKFNYENNKKIGKVILWDREMCEKLIREDYPQFSNLYYSVKYKIMRVDIIRFLILHKCGGLYIDLDVYINPNFELNFSKDIVFQSINEKNRMEIQFIYCKNRGEKFLIDFINTLEDKIMEKDKIEVYKQRIARYIFFTTGPRSFEKFYKTQKIDNDFILIPVERHSGTKKTQIIDVKDKIKNERFVIIPSAKWTHTIKDLKWKPVINYKF